MSDLARIEFLQEETRAHAAYLYEQLVQNLQQRGVVDTGTLVKSFIVRELGGSGLQEEINALFPTYGRFGDMGARRGWRKGQPTGRDGRTEALKAPKGHKVYSRTVWGSQNTLINNLANKFVEHARTNLKDTLTDGGNLAN